MSNVTDCDPSQTNLWEELKHIHFRLLGSTAGKNDLFKKVGTWAWNCASMKTKA